MQINGGWRKTLQPLGWRCPQHPGGPRALGNNVFQCFPDPSTLVIFKTAPLIQSLVEAQGGPGWACWLCQLQLPPVTELLGNGGSVCVWGDKHERAPGYFGRCKRGANSPAFISQLAGADSGCLCVELSRGLGYRLMVSSVLPPSSPRFSLQGHGWCFEQERYLGRRGRESQDLRAGFPSFPPSSGITCLATSISRPSSALAGLSVILQHILV